MKNSSRRKRFFAIVRLHRFYEPFISRALASVFAVSALFFFANGSR